MVVKPTQSKRYETLLRSPVQVGGVRQRTAGVASRAHGRTSRGLVTTSSAHFPGQQYAAREGCVMKLRGALERLAGLLVLAVLVAGFMARNAGYSLSDLPHALSGNLSGVVDGWGGEDEKFNSDYSILALDDNGRPVTFSRKPIDYVIDTSVSASDEERIRAAFAKTAAAGGFEFRYAGRTGFEASLTNLEQSPAAIVVSYTTKGASDAFHGMPSESVAVGYSVVQGGVRTRGAVVVSEEDAVHGVSLERLIMHELGHVLGLGHAESGTQIMGPHLQGSYPAKWGSGDLKALWLLRGA